MLVLTRKATETIQIGDNVVIKIICTGTKSVRIGIEAPDDVRIMRGELLEETYSPATLPFAKDDQPIVADAVADVEPSVPLSVEEPVVIGPMSAQKFIHEFNDVLPGRSIRRMLEARKQAAAVVK
jgi:carbon storage regulator